MSGSRIAKTFDNSISGGISKRIRKYTLNIFIQRAKEIHGDKYDYSEIISEDIKNSGSKIPIKCNTCYYSWKPTIRDHINSKSGCPSCSGCAPWTFERILSKCNVIHGDRYDYSLISKDLTFKNTSNIKIKCNTCEHIWFPSISDHVNKRHGCPNCARNLKWTFPRFLIKATEMHNGKYDYSLIKENDIINCKSKIRIKCNTCDNEWESTVHGHINRKSCCPVCFGHIPWTHHRFITLAKAIHNDKYDYSNTNPDHVQRKSSLIQIKCKLCEYQWNSTIDNHIYGKHGCIRCANCVQWKYDQFMIKARDTHGNKYDYSQIKESDISNVESRINVHCNTCKRFWECSLRNHIHNESKCPHCSKNKGYSQKQIDWLESTMVSENIIIRYALSSEGEYKIPSIGRVDGYCIETNTVYEYHGKFWHGHPDKYFPEDIHPMNGKTYGELYQATIDRDQKIRNLGYNLVIKWEE